MLEGHSPELMVNYKLIAKIWISCCLHKVTLMALLMTVTSTAEDSLMGLCNITFTYSCKDQSSNICTSHKLPSP